MTDLQPILLLTLPLLITSKNTMQLQNQVGGLYFRSSTCKNRSMHNQFFVDYGRYRLNLHNAQACVLCSQIHLALCRGRAKTTLEFLPSVQEKLFTLGAQLWTRYLLPSFLFNQAIDFCQYNARSLWYLRFFMTVLVANHISQTLPRFFFGQVPNCRRAVISREFR